MHKPTNYYSPQMVLQLTKLLEQLQNEITVLGNAGMHCTIKELNETNELLSYECRQYASEILDYIHSFTGNPQPAVLPGDNHTAGNNECEGYSISDRERLAHFKDAEQRLLAAYRTALNEPFITHDVRVILRRQFNSLLYLFLQTKMLDAAH